MMDNWRRKKGDSYSQEAAKTRSQNRKPPLGSWQPTVPSWEKKFCTSIGSVPWRKLLETKKFMYLYDNVVKWNDSAGEEAFYNAKNRFWAEINGLPCDISLPDPDIYIDEIDWNSNIDPELLLDLERDYVVPDGGEKDEEVVIVGKHLLLNQSFSCTGWGEEDEDLKKVAKSFLDTNEKLQERNSCTHNVGTVRESGWGDVCDNLWSGNQGDEGMKDSGWGDGNSCTHNVGTVRESGWGDVCDNLWSGNQGDEGMKDGGWGDGWNNSWGLNQWENNNYESENLKDGSDRVWGTWDVNNGKALKDGSDRVWGTWDVNNGKAEDTVRYMSRYKTLRFHGEDHQRSRGEWRNGKVRKRANFVFERPFSDKRPAAASKQWT